MKLPQKPTAPNRRQTLQQRWMRLLLVLVVTFPLAWYGPADFQFLQGAVAITGTVVALEPQQSGIGPREVRVSFDLGPERLRYAAALYWFQHYEVGDPVKVIFNPEVRPYLKLDSLWQRYHFVGVWLLMIAGIIAVTGLRALVARRLRRSQSRPKP